VRGETKPEVKVLVVVYATRESCKQLMCYTKRPRSSKAIRMMLPVCWNNKEKPPPTGDAFPFASKTRSTSRLFDWLVAHHFPSLRCTGTCNISMRDPCMKLVRVEEVGKVEILRESLSLSLLSWLGAVRCES
jgi:hypothetical protein